MNYIALKNLGKVKVDVMAYSNEKPSDEKIKELINGGSRVFNVLKGVEYRVSGNDIVEDSASYTPEITEYSRVVEDYSFKQMDL